MNNVEIPLIYNAEEAEAVLALKKTKINCEIMKDMHKKRILNLLKMSMDVTIKSIEAKKNMLREEIQRRQTDYESDQSGDDIE